MRPGTTLSLYLGVVLCLVISPSLCTGVMPCAGSPSSCTELQHQTCADTDGDGAGDTCLCEPGYYLRLASSCHALPDSGEPISPCMDDSPCQNGGQCVYNETLRRMDCVCPSGFKGLRCEQEAALCSPGQYLERGRCIACPIGTFKAIDGNDPCEPCPPGINDSRQVTAAEGSTSQQDCTQGPRVLNLAPPYGPIAGGTEVNITVSVVPGYQLSDITSITVGGASCTPTNASGLAAHVTQCRTSPVDAVRSGPVTLTLHGLDFTSSAKYQYRPNPVIEKVGTNTTFISGGKKVQIVGDHLDSVFSPLITISKVTSLEEFHHVEITKSRCTAVSALLMECRMPSLRKLVFQPREQRPPEGDKGQPDPQPTVVVLSSTTSTTTRRREEPRPTERPAEGEGEILRETPRETPRETTGEVERENPSETPVERERETTEQKPTETPMEAEREIPEEIPWESPEGGRRRRAAAPSYGEINTKFTKFWLGFELDGVGQYRNMSEVLVYHDPEVKPKAIEPDVYYFDYEFFRGVLGISGARLNLGAGPADYVVEVGVEYCNVTYLSTNALHCLLPPHLPAPKAKHRGPKDIPRMKVVVGNLRYDVGLIAYKSGPVAGHVVLGVVLGVLLIIAVIVVAACLIRRRRRQKAARDDHLRQGVALAPGNIYSETRPSQRGATNGSAGGYLRPVVDNTPRSSLSSHLSGNSLTPLMITMPTGSLGSIAQLLDKTPSTPTTPNMAENVAYHLMPRHNSIPFDIMSAISEDLRIIIEECRLDSSQLQLKDSIGKGFFGKVYRGILTDKNGENDTTVAIKTIQGMECTVKDVEAFLAEAIVMKDCHHDNVLSLLGVVIAGHRPFAVLPYMEHGDLRSYIAEPDRSIKVRELLGFGVQVSAGMEYLAYQKIVHRDLATRNCMINESLTVRIADFGLSRDVYKSDYYRVEDKHRPLPVKWMAIESLTGGVFSSSSDVWSFGVLLWELLTRGCPPYPDIDTFNLKNYLLSGRRLPQPEHAPDEVYDIMAGCWLVRPEDRPTFTQLKDRLTGIVDRDEEAMTPEYLKLI